MRSRAAAASAAVLLLTVLVRAQTAPDGEDFPDIIDHFK